MLKRTLLLLAALAALAAWAIPAAAGYATHQDADVFAFADLPDLIDAGDADLTRTGSTVKAKFTMDDAPEGVYSLWWVVWNTPEGCETPYACNEPDLFNPNAGLAIGYAGGGTVGPSGNLAINARLTEGQELTGFPYPEFSEVGLQLQDPTMFDSRHAELHLVLRSHGDGIPGLFGEMRRTFNAGCEYVGPIDGSAPTYGTPGPNECEDVYFAVFPSEHTM